MTPVYSTTSLAEAYALRSLLEGHGIEAVVANEGGAFFAVGLPSPALPLILAVPPARAEEASRLLAESRAVEPLTAEEADFAERVRRSERISRRGWRAALGVLVVGPLLGGPLLALADGSPAALLPAVVLALALLGVPAAVILSARRGRRATSSANSPSA